MDTCLVWERDEKDSEIIPDYFEDGWLLPEGSFECHRLQAGDDIELMMECLDGSTQFISLTVASVEVSLKFKMDKFNCSPVVTPTQWVRLTGIREAKEVNHEQDYEQKSHIT